MLDDGKIPKKPKKPLVFYYSIILLVLVLLNSFVFPKMIERSVKNVDYSEFVTMLENRQITEATLDGDKVYFTTGTGENRVIYKTVAMEDGNDLVDRLNAANVDKFGKAEIKQTSPIVSFLLSGSKTMSIPYFAAWSAGTLPESFSDNIKSLNFAELRAFLAYKKYLRKTEEG